MGLSHPSPGMLSAETSDWDTTNTKQSSAFVSLPPSMFEEINDKENTSHVGVYFNLYKTSSLLPLGNGSRENYTLGSPVIGATVAGHIVENLTEPVTVVLRLHDEVRRCFSHLEYITMATKSLHTSS